METSLKGKVEIIAAEGICPRIYFDTVGVRTLGVGCTVSEIPNIATMSLSVYHPIPELMMLFIKALKKYEVTVNNACKVRISQQQFDALVSICYNIGQQGLKGSTFMRRLNAGESAERVANGIMMWTKQPELIRRRKREAELFEFGKYSSDGMVQLTDTDGNGREKLKLAKMIDIYKLLDMAGKEETKSIDKSSVDDRGNTKEVDGSSYTYDLNKLTLQDVVEFLDNVWDAYIKPKV